MAFVYRFTEEEVIKDFKKELYITVNPLTNEEIITNLKNIINFLCFNKKSMHNTRRNSLWKISCN